MHILEACIHRWHNLILWLFSQKEALLGPAGIVNYNFNEE